MQQCLGGACRVAEPTASLLLTADLAKPGQRHLLHMHIDLPNIFSLVVDDARHVLLQAFCCCFPCVSLGARTRSAPELYRIESAPPQQVLL